MTRIEAQQKAHNLYLGNVRFECRVATNTGRLMEVGYVLIPEYGEKLFCKRQSTSDEDGFYLCNEFREE